MKIYRITNKRDYLPLLLLADEQENMVEKYLDKGIMFVLDDDGIKAEIVICDEGNGVPEIKNLAVEPKFQRQGYGRKLINFVCEYYRGKYSFIQVGTGNSPLTVPFYEKCGFRRSRIVKNFFTKNYDHPINECGIQLTDMIYLTKELK
ncbi:MAG TPA: GNAT family N-acetyltransferase [Firmicutes bacterium]|nr:GNAT family N-acetyltransferase [Bacillota bacterium]